MKQAGYIVALVLLAATSARAGDITGTVTFNGVKQENAAVHLVGITKAATVPAKGAVLVQKKQTFIPAVLPVIKGTEVSLPNKDTVFHNAFSLSKGNAFDLGQYGPGKKPKVVFKEPGVADIFCNMHEQMHAVVMVLEHPYLALTDDKGHYTIRGVPEGIYEIKAWISPRVSQVISVTVKPEGAAGVDFAIKK